MIGYPSEVQNLQFPFNCFRVRLKGYDNQAQEAANLFSSLSKNEHFAKNKGFKIIDIFYNKECRSTVNACKHFHHPHEISFLLCQRTGVVQERII